MKRTSSNKAVSLAVLPFVNLSPENEYDYFATGFVEELIVDLSNFHDLQIISSYTANLLSDGENEIAAARKISIDYLLKGSLRIMQKKLRLNTQLLSSKTGEIIWAERFDAPVEDIFEIQDNLVQRVVYAISSEVEQTVLQQARQKPVTSLEAYDCLLRGMDKLRLGTLEADQEARGFFNQALEIDPNLSKAYAGLSLSHFNEWSCQIWELYESSEQNAYNYAVKAFQLDDSDHIIQMILGRIYIYRHQFDQAEIHIERSLELNSNDADNLVQLATCMAFLGRASKGEELFKKALQLNPYRNLWYYQYGSVIYFVERNFELSIEMSLKRQLTNIWVDLPGYIAAAYAHLGNRDMAKLYLNKFLEAFTASITRGAVPDANEVEQWTRRANPFKHQEDIDCVVEGLYLAGLDRELKAFPKNGILPKQPARSEAPNIFLKEDQIWRMEFDNFEITMPDIKGYGDLGKLLASPETDIHCSELMGTISSMDETDFTIDEKARKEYEKHITELQSEIEDAEEFNDIGRKEKLQGELDQLLNQLQKDLGIGKRPRKLKSPADRARAAVTLRIRHAIKKISEKHPSLGKHFHNSIRTGVFCKYSPEENRQWRLS